jgi:hypothetical protein
MFRRLNSFYLIICLTQAAAEAKKKAVEEKLEKAETAAIKKEAPAPAPKPAPAPTPAPSSGGAALGKISGTAAGGKVLPKEELDPAVLQLLKVRIAQKRGYLPMLKGKNGCLTSLFYFYRNKYYKLALWGSSPSRINSRDFKVVAPSAFGEFSIYIHLTKKILRRNDLASIRVHNSIISNASPKSKCNAHTIRLAFLYPPFNYHYIRSHLRPRLLQIWPPLLVLLLVLLLLERISWLELPSIGRQYLVQTAYNSNTQSIGSIQGLVAEGLSNRLLCVS